MFEFQNLEVYKKAVAFHLNCKKILGKIKIEKYVNDQLGRASYSIVLNIAEGCTKSSKADRKNYFTTARDSVFECVAVLDIMHQSKELEEETYNINLKLADELSRILYKMISNWMKTQSSNYKISFQELAFLNRKVLSMQPAITFAQALQQIQKLKKTSNINKELKKSRS